MKSPRKVPKIASFADSSNPASSCKHNTSGSPRTGLWSAIRQLDRADVPDAPGGTVAWPETHCSMVENLEKRSAAAIGRLIAKGGLDPVEVAKFFLDRIERDRANPSFILVTRKRALEEAEASRKRHREGRAAGPLDGVPIAWKDLVDMAGERTTAGSALYADAPPKERDAPIVTNLAAAGMVALGKTNLSEFAFSALGLNPHFGTPRNPRDPTTPRVAGGSSSGAAVAVAGGLAPCAIGSDTGGPVPAPGRLFGPRRVQDQRGADRQAGRISTFTHARHDRPASAHGRGLRADRYGAARTIEQF